MKLLLFSITISLALLSSALCFRSKSDNELLELKKQYEDPRDNAENYNWYKSTDPVAAALKYNRENNKTIEYEPKKNVNVPSLYGSLYWQGWIKYFHYDSSVEITKPSSFYENPNFYSQKVLEKNLNLKDKSGHRVYIPGKDHFWGMLLANNNFNILGSRKDASTPGAKTIDNLNLDLIKYIIPDDNANGAVHDLGSFHEGNCLKVETKRPEAKRNANFNSRTDEGIDEDWIFCTDTKKQKDYLMRYLIAVKLRRQKEIDDVLEEVKPVEVDKFQVASELMNSKIAGPVIVKYKGADASPDDGYWILLQDWSDCSLKCGGGIQTQQWMCVPPRNKGKPCMGESIRTRKCNDKVCPTTLYEKPLIPEKKNVLNLAPIYKALPYSKRPAQYIKCFVKEGDVLYKTKEYDPEKKNYVKVPGRIVMNTQTISVFKDDSYENSLFNFNLSDTVIKTSKTDYCCFILLNANRSFEMCGFNNNCGTAANPVWVNDWWRDFDYFRQKCFRELKENSLHVKNQLFPNNKPQQPGASIPLTMGDDGRPQAQLSAAEKELVEGRKSVIESELKNKEENDLDKKVSQAQNITLTALRREINLEDMIKNEEIEKGRKENEELKEQVEQEKKKKKMLTAALQARESNYAQMRVQKDTQKQIDEIKKEAKIDIKFKRAVLKKKLDAIRNKFKRKNRMLQQQVQIIRSEMANEIMAANKRGSLVNCQQARGDLAKIKDYCDSNYSEDIQKNQSCKEPENFCYSCCEAEYGNMFMSERDDCETMCDRLDKSDLDNGEWIWNAGNGLDIKDGQTQPQSNPVSTP